MFNTRRAAESPLYKQQVSSYNEQTSGDVVIAMPQSALMTTERYISSRGEAVQNIERTIGELQGIFSQLANIVAEQGELIERIDHNVDNTVLNVDSAQNELLKYLSSV